MVTNAGPIGRGLAMKAGILDDSLLGELTAVLPTMWTSPFFVVPSSIRVILPSPPRSVCRSSTTADVPSFGAGDLSQ